MMQKSIQNNDVVGSGTVVVVNGSGTVSPVNGSSGASPIVGTGGANLSLVFLAKSHVNVVTNSKNKTRTPRTNQL